ncbi:hypothetical protein IEQ34_002846 [Dendrobium chrysotoxum]|uniref:Protein kinase domain-containing protein n=1 Tax=Dendrobium chrysotoxum TaxID=161865 RepID=A0AAV7HJR6_DENCH|nr:hypothetical protein IEQ34_002846 [Dendrobium chrysotoxum]
MTTGRLCFILPIDADDIANKTKNPPSKYPGGNNLSLSDLALRSLDCFCSRRCPNLSCFQPKPDHYSEFYDADGVTYDALPSKKNGGPRIFSYAELYIGTKGFSDKEVLGSGGFGRVYRAVLPSDGSTVAVKCVAGGRDHRFEKSFAAELVAVAQLRHRNLVRLRGWCSHDHQLLLVYDYMPNRSLDRLLFVPSPTSLGWDRRRQIVAGLATALFYLHEQLDTQIIHRDVKASNVMLDSGYNARLGDFGLARWIEHGEADHPVKQQTASIRSGSSSNYEFRITDTSRIGGTIGYLPPESFQRRGGATAKSDVFSFGVVVLEVATGRRVVDLAYSDDKIFMLDWVRRLADDGELLSAGDKQLPDGSYPLPEIGRLLHLGLLCSLHDPQSRPTMKWVMETLVCDTVGDLPALPSFHSQPLYLSLSSSSATTTTGTVFSSNYLTAMGSTVFLTANDENSSSQRKAVLFPNVNTPRTISYKEIVEITNNFSESRMVAELDFGTGYHGLLDNRFHVLVKRLGMKTCPALRLRFSDELSNLGHLRHRHLVQLRGWCTEHGEMLVVYDYPSGGVLSRRLFYRHNSPAAAVLSWRQRYRIIKALASAVLYLHEEWDEQVIHRSITSSSVFLDPDLSPRLGCFALAEFLSRNENGGPHVASTVRSSSARGIFGYMSPEYMETGKATTAADVYSFGVVVLEIVCGRPAVDLRRPEALLVRRWWGMEARRRPAEEMADERLEGNFDRKEVERMVRLGTACTLSKADRRPNMRQIVSILDGNDELLRMMGHKREAREEWEANNANALALVRRMKTLGIH